MAFLPIRRVAHLLLLAGVAFGAVLAQPEPAAAQGEPHGNAGGAHDQGRHLG